jgi:hypothetical protein
MRSPPWYQSPDVDLGPRYGEADAEHAAWAAKLARVLIDKPEGVGLFFRVAFNGVSVCVLEGRGDDDNGRQLDARSIVSINVHGADCGDP